MSLRSAAQQNAHMQTHQAKPFLLLSPVVQRAAHVALPQCLTAIVVNVIQLWVPTQQFVHQMFIFCGFCTLPCPSQFRSETFFGAQRRVVLPLRGSFQALPRRCTNLGIISWSTVALSQCLQIVGQHRSTRAHTRREWCCICLGHIPKSMAVGPLSTTIASCAPFAQWQVPTPSLGSIIHHPHVI